jgi:SAM-dependent MidA family methyltransferase
MNTTLFGDFLKQSIIMMGPMPFSVFMHRVVAYYYENQAPFGAKGDFITAPEISQLFGKTLAVWCAQQILECAQPCSIVELGGGNGTMMRDILSVISKIPSVWDLVREMHIVERSTLLKTRQREALQDFEGMVIWHEDIDTLPAQPAIVLANEFWDALPIAQYQVRNGRLYERYVGMDAHGEFCWLLGPDAVEIAAAPALMDAGSIIEIGRAGCEILKCILGHYKGYDMRMLIIDYGYIEPEHNATVQSVYRHTHVGVFDYLGEADISALVDFGALLKCTLDAGVKNVILSTQADFLKHNGIVQLADKAVKMRSSSQQIIADLERLLSSEQMGELFKVLQIIANPL